jgi:hypothetical protein
MKLPIFIMALATIIATPVQARESDAQIVKKIIQESIDSYPGNCPCPYNSARNGSSCGRRSAWSRRGGYAPKCYAADVSKSDIAEYRQR